MSGQRRHPGLGRQGGWQQADLPVADDASAWIRGRMPDGWFTEPVEVTVDREEIVIVGRVAEPDASAAARPSDGAAVDLEKIRRNRRPDRAIVRGGVQRP
ncbi:hypothetical protein [Fodinicola feengrottensis]|uniref:hypothetical protein n=1 Tax=Fodinicola feengrottensis TaxID=435914 RepID=UPI0013D33BBE|nr:hypothetical protein [Fodinicola feengrottensis]